METLILEDTQIIEKQNRLLEEKNRAMTESLNYAKLIQNAITHKNETLSKVVPQSFILDMPLDIVSGDFVRIDQKEGKILIGLADCTGHGIPGALMSMVGCALLYDIINCKQETRPAEILKLLNSNFKKLTSEPAAINDGMDISYCSIDVSNLTLNYSGAKRPLFIVRNGVFTQIKGDNLSIGGHSGKESEFKSFIFKLQKNDTLYMFSDGFGDQFGGDKGKKYSTQRFKETLLSIQHLGMQEQKAYLEQEINGWKNGLAQVDDICVLGFRI
jgi:serine phosphatase RsbU (regulator of sigma subunit)